jgi:hypothetical protein
MDSIDVWRTAQILRQWKGERAQEFAAGRITGLTLEGDHVGAAVWSDILAAIAVLSIEEPPDSLPRH